MSNTPYTFSTLSFNNCQLQHRLERERINYKTSPRPLKHSLCIFIFTTNSPAEEDIFLIKTNGI